MVDPEVRVVETGWPSRRSRPQLLLCRVGRRVQPPANGSGRGVRDHHRRARRTAHQGARTLPREHQCAKAKGTGAWLSYTLDHIERVIPWSPSTLSSDTFGDTWVVVTPLVTLCTIGNETTSDGKTQVRGKIQQEACSCRSGGTR